MPHHPSKPSKFWGVWELEQKLMNLPASDRTLSTTTLKNMGIERAPQLDIDNPNAVDADAVFFKPFPDTFDFRSAVAERVRDYGGVVQWGYHCPDEVPHVDRLSCALHVIDRLDHLGYFAILIHNLYPADAENWRESSAGRGIYLPSYSGRSEYLKKHGDRPPQPLLEWFTPSIRYVPSKPGGMRHCVGYLADNTPHKRKPDEALRSEITAGVSYIRKRIQVTQDTHSIIPVLVISFYHSDTVRITQMCWNGEEDPISFRQSRLVDIASNSFNTPEIFLLLRWIRCIPVREPEVSRRQTTTRGHALAARPGRPTTPVQNGTANNAAAPAAAHAAGTTNTPTRPSTPTPAQTQKGPVIASGSNTSSPPRSAIATPIGRTLPSGDTRNSPSRAATPTPTRSTPNNDNTAAITTPSRNAASTTSGGAGNPAAVGHATTTPRQTSLPPARHSGNAPPGRSHQSGGLPTRSASDNGDGSGGLNGNGGPKSHAQGLSHGQYVAGHR